MLPSEVENTLFNTITRSCESTEIPTASIFCLTHPFLDAGDETSKVKALLHFSKGYSTLVMYGRVICEYLSQK